MIKSPQPGDQLDDYRIDDVVARSGMASVFRGTDLRTGRPVAIKVPHPEMECDPLFFDRFHREAEIGRRLDHCGVVKVFPADDASRVYLAMEWVEGRPLRQLLDEQKKFSPERTVRIALGVCDALHYIHSRGIVHRDLKPDNIMVDTEDHIKLIDFGIAQTAGARRLTFARLTKSMGTPDYISPEQVKGKRGDARSDIYSLGVILYEMLVGRVPFDGPSPLAAMNSRLLNNPESPSEINPEISRQFEEVILRAMDRAPQNRYATAREFAFDLEHLDRVGVEERPSLGPPKPQRSPRERMPPSCWMLMMIPAIIFALLLFVARQR
jgi:serine/threonine protein kinase